MRRIGPLFGLFGAAAMLSAAAPVRAQDSADSDLTTPDHVSMTNARLEGSGPAGASLFDKAKRDKSADDLMHKATKADAKRDPAPAMPGDPLAGLYAPGFPGGLPEGARMDSFVDTDGTLTITVDTPDGGRRIIRTGQGAGGQQTFVLRTN